MSAINHSPESRLTLWKHLRRQVAYYILHLIEGDHNWGQMRFLTVVVIILFFGLLGRIFETPTDLPLLDPLLEATGYKAVLELLPPQVTDAIRLFASIFTRQSWRHIIPPLAGFLLAFYIGAAFVRDLLEFHDIGPAFKFLSTSLFGINYPYMIIDNGQAFVEDPQTNPMLKIGGPGWVIVRLGSAALFERVAGPSQVLDAGIHFIRRFEILRDALDLREIERVKNDVPILTKDGIPLVLADIHIRFRIGTRESRTEANPYPIKTSAVRQAVYCRRVDEKGLENWIDVVAGNVQTTITGWFQRRRMNELIPPPPAEPETHLTPPVETYREAIHKIFQDKDTRKRFAEFGAEVVWVSVGHLRPDPNVDPDADSEEAAKGRDKVHKQMIATWKAWHEAQARGEMVEAQGYANWLENTARAQVHAELILGITAGLKEARDAGLPMAELITARVAEYLATFVNRSRYSDTHLSGAFLQTTDSGEELIG